MDGAALISLVAVGLAVVASCRAPAGPLSAARDRAWLGAESQRAAELQFFAPYAAQLGDSCGKAFEISLVRRSDTVVETDPPVYESEWELKACNQTMHAILDCSRRGSKWQCGAHEWPPTLMADALLGHAMEAAAARAPDCSPEAGGRSEAFSLRRVKEELNTTREPWTSLGAYVVTRCERAVEVRVECTLAEPYPCVAQSVR